MRRNIVLFAIVLTLTALFGWFSATGASGDVAADGWAELPPVTTSAESDEPKIEDIEPDEGQPGQTLHLAITGENTHFNDTSEVSFSPTDGITVSALTVDNATSLTVTIAIAADTPAGKRDVTVTTTITEGVTEVVTKEHGFEVVPADEPEEVEFKGVITSVTIANENAPITGTITVRTGYDAPSLTPVTPITWTVHINTETRIRIGPDQAGGTIADLAVGQWVEVEGILQSDGSVLALKVHVELKDDELVGFRGIIVAKSSNVTTTTTLSPTLTVQMGSRILTVVTDADTDIRDADGQPITFADLQVGQVIKGKGILREDGSILATEIQVVDTVHKWVRFEGVITSLPNGGLIGEWTVRTSFTITVTFTVDENTRITPPQFRPAVGDWARVVAVRREDGTLLALKVHLRRPQHHPRPVEFRGTIAEISGELPTMIVVNVWGHNEYTDAAGALVDVLIDDLTRIEGELMVGAHVKVHGFLLDNRTVLARLIVVKPPEVEFRGRIESIEDDLWIVSGITVLITDSTIITGTTPQVGLLAEVKGIRVEPRTVRATKIEVMDPSLAPMVIRGIITGLPGSADHIGTWTIITEEGNIVSIQVAQETVIDTKHGEVKISALVRVTVVRQDDGTLLAKRIKVFESD